MSEKREYSPNITKDYHHKPKTAEAWRALYTSLTGKKHLFADLPISTDEADRVLTYEEFQKLAILCRMNPGDADLITFVDKIVQAARTSMEN